MKRFAFIMDPLEVLDLPWDTSLCLVRALVSRQHKCFLFTPESLSLERGQVKGCGQEIIPLGSHRYQKGRVKKWDLASFDAVLIRKDPPFDSDYLSLTYLLETLNEKIRVINHPRGIRNANEKLFGLHFTRLSPPSLVATDPEEILDFQKKIRNDLVIKPLFEKGGKGVFLLDQKKKGLKSLLAKATQGGKKFVVAQRFIPVREGEGDKRILIWKGEILGAFSRIPRSGEFRSNLSLGGRFVSCRVSRPEKEIVRTLKPALLGEGLSFVGIDTRGELLMEVNVTSPAGLVELEQLYGPEATARVAKSLASGKD